MCFTSIELFFLSENKLALNVVLSQSENLFSVKHSNRRPSVENFKKRKGDYYAFSLKSFPQMIFFSRLSPILVCLFLMRQFFNWILIKKTGEGTHRKFLNYDSCYQYPL